MKNNFYTAIGLMSGTSMDGIDASLIKSNGINEFINIFDRYYQFDEKLYQKLINLRNLIYSIDNLNNYSNDLKELERDLTIFHSQIVNEIIEGVPIMGSVAAGGLIETYSDVQESLDISDVLKKKNVFALTVNGDSMIEACIADGDMVLMEPITDKYSLRNGTIVSAMVPGLGTTLKYFFKRGEKIFLEAANPAYEPIELNLNQVVFQGKLLAVWRKI